MPTVEVVTTGERSARITLNRPHRLNALSPELLRDLVAVCHDLSHEPSIRVLTLEGDGDTFSAGADLPAFAAELASSRSTTADLGRAATEALAGLPQITVAVIQGHCVGGAAVLAAACDLRICSTDSRFWIPELEAGIPLGWGGLAHLVRLVGETMASDLVLTARPFDADEALRAGFVSRIIEPEDLHREAAALVESIASKARHPLRVTKQQLRSLRAGSFDATRDAEALLMSLSDPEAGATLRRYTDRLR